MVTYIHRKSFGKQILRRLFSVETGKKPDCLYSVLGVKPDSSMSEIRKRYFELAKIHHPDVAKSADSGDKFQRISAAYETLSNPSSRKSYNAKMGYEINSSMEENESAAFESEPLFKKYYEMGNRQFSKRENPYEWENFVDMSLFEKIEKELASKNTNENQSKQSEISGSGKISKTGIADCAKEYFIPFLYLLGVFVAGGLIRALYLDMVRRKNAQIHEVTDVKKYDRKQLKGIIHKNTTLGLF